MRIIGAKREAPRMPIRTGPSPSGMGAMLAVDRVAECWAHRLARSGRKALCVEKTRGRARNLAHFRHLTQSIASARASTRHTACYPNYQLRERISVSAGSRSERPAAR